MFNAMLAIYYKFLKNAMVIDSKQAQILIFDF